MRRGIMERIDKLTSSHAYDCGFWPDGRPYVRGEAVDYRDFVAGDNAVIIAHPGEDGHRMVARVITGRFNAISRHQARSLGKWPNGRPYAESDPDPYAISATYDDAMAGKGSGHRTADEDAGPGGPWWLITPKRNTS